MIQSACARISTALKTWSCSCLNDRKCYLGMYSSTEKQHHQASSPNCIWWWYCSVDRCRWWVRQSNVISDKNMWIHGETSDLAVRHLLTTACVLQFLDTDSMCYYWDVFVMHYVCNYVCMSTHILCLCSGRHGLVFRVLRAVHHCVSSDCLMFRVLCAVHHYVSSDLVLYSRHCVQYITVYHQT